MVDEWGCATQTCCRAWNSTSPRPWIHSHTGPRVVTGEHKLRLKTSDAPCCRVVASQIAVSRGVAAPQLSVCARCHGRVLCLAGDADAHQLVLVSGSAESGERQWRHRRAAFEGTQAALEQALRGIQRMIAATNEGLDDSDGTTGVGVWLSGTTGRRVDPATAMLQHTAPKALC